METNNAFPFHHTHLIDIVVVNLFIKNLVEDVQQFKELKGLASSGELLKLVNLGEEDGGRLEQPGGLLLALHSVCHDRRQHLVQKFLRSLLLFPQVAIFALQSVGQNLNCPHGVPHQHEDKGGDEEDDGENDHRHGKVVVHRADLLVHYVLQVLPDVLQDLSQFVHQSHRTFKVLKNSQLFLSEICEVDHLDFAELSKRARESGDEDKDSNYLAKLIWMWSEMLNITKMVTNVC